MKFFQNIFCVAMLVFSTQACQPGGDCDPICGAEIKDPTNQRTFKNRRAMKKWNDSRQNEDESMTSILKQKIIFY